MAQIRTTIELLTKILNENGASKIKAEIFRLSKFNHKDAVSPLWKLIFELVYYCEYGKIDDTSVRAMGELTIAELVVYVKRSLQKRGFYSKDFAALPNDMSGGSREIVLALGWLLCKENIISRFIKNCTSPLDDDTGGLYEGSSNDLISIYESADTLPSKPDMYSKVQQLLWLNNKLKLNLCSLFALQREKNILKHRIHEATHGVAGSTDRNHLSQMEVYMLRHPELLKTNIELLERDNERLQNLLKWRDHEDIFWRWMGSVLDAKLREKYAPGDPAAGDTGADEEGGGTRHPQGSGDTCQAALSNMEATVFARLQETHTSLQDAILKYENIVEELENAWEEKSASVTDADLDDVLSSIDLELSIQRANIASNNCQSYLQDQTPERAVPSLQVSTSPPPRPRQPQFILERRAQNKSVPGRLRGSDSPAGKSVDPIRDIEDEIRQLNSLVGRMQNDVDDKQNSFKEEMQKLSTKFQDAICIPPMPRKF